ncbi:uncharacterized protein LOC115657258 [Gopherus evgoodei]|uniref:uncharacterized protein LOC115639081 n=1 Tax=Gopherus evgoodei TaxID=1825980 RepID=UPI0011CF0A48|nr:uncharacterized protein LOC115639081 [Gopherus evgoodei]XP_030430701.1 uncharacterized protein LOC115657258 [Gopherus evgoodei]
MIAAPPRENPLVAWLRAYALQEVLIGNLSDVPPSHDCVACTRPKASEGGSPFLWEFLPLTNLTPQHPASACNNTDWVHRPLFTCNTTSDDRRPNSFAPVAVTGPLPAAPCIVFFGFSNPTPLGQYPNCTQWFIGPRPNSNPKKGSSRYRTEFTRTSVALWEQHCPDCSTRIPKGGMCHRATRHKGRRALSPPSPLLLLTTQTTNSHRMGATQVSHRDGHRRVHTV